MPAGMPPPVPELPEGARSPFGDAVSKMHEHLREIVRLHEAELQLAAAGAPGDGVGSQKREKSMKSIATSHSPSGTAGVLSVKTSGFESSSPTISWMLDSKDESQDEAVLTPQPSPQHESGENGRRNSLSSLLTARSSSSLGSNHHAIEPIWLERRKRGKRRRSVQSEDSGIDAPSSVESSHTLGAGSGSITWQTSLDKGGDESRKVIFNPHSGGRILWDFVGALMVFYDLVLIPIQVFRPLLPGFLSTSSLTTLTFWTLDIPLNFLTGYPVQGLVEYRCRKVVKHYLRTWFVFDIFVVGTDWILTIFAAEGVSTSQLKVFKAMRLARMIRLVRLLKFRGILGRLVAKLRSEAGMILLSVSKLILFIIFVNHFIACGFFGVSRLAKQLGEGETWIEASGILEKTVPYQYITSLHWSVTQFTPASMEVVPVNTIERTYAVITIFFAMVTFSSFISSMTTAMTRFRQLSADKDHQHALLRQYMTENDCSVKLAARVWAFIDAVEKGAMHQRKQEKDVPLLAILPEELREGLQDEAYMPILGRHPLFKGLYNRHARAMCRVYSDALGETTRRLGLELFHEGKTAQNMYFVVGGEVKYCLNDVLPEEYQISVTAGEWLSEAALWLQWQHSGRAIAAVHSDFITINAAQFQKLMQHQLKGVVEPAHYAAAFTEYFQSETCVELTDVFCDMAVLKSLAVSAFDGRRLKWGGSSASTLSNEPENLNVSL